MGGPSARPRARPRDLVQLVGLYSLWRMGSQSAGRALVATLAGPDAARRTMAGMLLVKGGRRAVPLLREALGRRAGLPLTLTVLGDVGDPSTARDLDPFLADPDPAVARAAREAQRTLAHRS